MAEKTVLCYNCFQEKETQEGPCPYCGFDLAENEKKFPVALRAGTVLNGRYIVGRVLGQGGFGITYLAWDTKLEARVAVKEFMPNEIATRVGTTVSVAVESRTQDFTYGAERFQEEARTLAKFMGQPNIAGVTDYFDENDTSYFVMDYIEGISFKTYIANHGGKVSVEEALNVMIPVLRALTAVHAEGFIHRDVTPDNIYITKDGQVKLLDFGSARYSIGDKSKSLDVVLKVGYAPKEQYIRRSRQGPYTDVYSCAACLYAAITGFLPPESLERLDEDTLVPISQCGIGIPEYLDKAILKGLAVQPEDRFQSAAEFLDAIESQRVVEVPVSGGAAAAPAPEKKKIKPALIAGLAAVVVVAVGVGMALGGGGGSGSGGGGNPVSEALAPKVTIGGESYSTALTELELDGSNLTDADFQTLREFPSLTKLEITYPEGLGMSDLTPLSGLTNLTYLRVRTQGLTSLDGIETLTRLETLNIDGQDATFPSLEPLGYLTELKNLRLPIYKADLNIFADLTPLANCPHLESLQMDHKVMDLSPLSGLTHMVSLSLLDGYGYMMKDMGGFQSTAPLRNLTNLVSLSLRSYNIQDLTGLENLHTLENLYIETGEQLTDISALRDLENLTNVTLQFDGQENRIADMSPLDHVPNVNIT